MTAPFLYSSDLLAYDMGPHHPLRPERTGETLQLLTDFGVTAQYLQIVAPAEESEYEIRAVHAADYVDAVQRASEGRPDSSLRRFGLGTGDNPIFNGMYEAAALCCGAAASAAQYVVNGADLAFSFSGGLHHAHFDCAAGFCVFNDPAFAINALKERFERVAYVDIDVHHGDGVQELFYHRSDVLTLSIHQDGRTLFPGTGSVAGMGTGAGQGFSVNLPVAPFTEDGVWLDVWRRAGIPILQAFRPDAIVLQLGADAHRDDPLANVMLTTRGWLQAVTDVREIGVPIVALGGGGYNRNTVPRMWTLATAELLRVELPNAVPETSPLRKRMPFLHDAPETDHPQWESETSVDRTKRAASEVISEIRRRVFPLHGIPAT
ncbi:MAG: acetoin utilization protein AcuC [Armatimonadetes bacterium]|nr:acetoin utilization protein AcuC [Armatimonadota bacterium]MDE2205885.1 acetoin utilization protein AcuC [Armatimonadota bacterium]